MKIKSDVTTFKPITIVIETQEDFDKFENVLEYAYNEAACGSDTEAQADELLDLIRDAA